MVLYMIGLGLGNHKDISVKGLEAIKKCNKVYLESYTSKLNCTKEDLKQLYQKEDNDIIFADRELVEKQAEQTILKDAETQPIAFLVIGDVFSATTHVDIRMRAENKGIKTIIIHGASIISAVGITGLEIYKFGKTISIPFHNKDVVSPINTIKENKESGLHSLVLLDLDLKNNKMMTINEALEYLTDNKNKNNKIEDSQLCIGCGAIGTDEPEIKTGTIKELKTIKFTKFPQCLIIPGNLHFMEEESINSFR